MISQYSRLIGSVPTSKSMVLQILLKFYSIAYMNSWRHRLKYIVLGAILTTGCQGEAPIYPGKTEKVSIRSQQELNTWVETQTEHFVVQGDLCIDGSDLRNVGALNGLVGIEGDFVIRENKWLRDLQGLEQLGYVDGGIYIIYNGLVALTGLEGLERIGGDLEISCNFSLRNLNGLKKLQRVGGHLFVDATTKLAQIDGLGGLVQVGGTVKLRDNKALRDLKGLGALRQIDEDLLLIFNSALNDLRGLEGISSVKGELTIDGHPTLKSLEGLQNIVEVGGSLTINENYALEQLDALSGLRRVGKSLYIGRNTLLQNLDGLANLGHIGTGERDLLIVELNPLLPMSAGYQLAEQLALSEGRFIVFDNLPPRSL